MSKSENFKEGHIHRERFLCIEIIKNTFIPVQVISTINGDVVLTLTCELK